MPNYYHVILHINQEYIAQWSDRRVCEQWLRLCKGSELSRRFIKNFSLSHDEQLLLFAYIQRWRKQFIDVSWFMRALNESIARQANAEDQCKGRFWEARFSSQALLDEKALVACMAYVNRNPTRARVNSSAQTSPYTSIKKCIEKYKQQNTQPST